MNQPTSEAWIDPWVSYLTEKGVTFHFNTKGSDSVDADEYVMCIPPPIEKPNDQISFRIGFSRKITFESTTIAFVLLDSPYDITFYPQDVHWSPDVDLGPVESLWSGTIIQGSKAVGLTPKQLLQEIKRQLLKSTYVKGLISEEDIVYEEIFEDWYWNGKRLVSKHPKWVNSVGETRPSNETEIPNMWVAGAHTKTSTDVWSMESAVESGKLAANLILQKYNLEPCFVKRHDVKLGRYDDPFYAVGFPHLVDCFVLLIVLFILLKSTGIVRP